MGQEMQGGIFGSNSHRYHTALLLLCMSASFLRTG